MPRYFWTWLILVVGASVLVQGDEGPGPLALAVGKEAAGDDPQSEPRTIPLADLAGTVSAEVTAEKKLRAKLLKEVVADFEGEPLKAVVQYLAKEAGTESFRLDETALKEEGIAEDEPIQVSLGRVTAAVALSRVTKPLGLIWTIDDEQLKVTTAVKADEEFVLRVYDLRKIKEALKRNGLPKPTSPETNWLTQTGPFSSDTVVKVVEDPMEHLIEILMVASEGTRWDTFDGPPLGYITPIADAVLVRAPYALQSRVEGAVRALETAAAGDLGLSAVPIETWHSSPGADAAVRAALRRTVVVCECTDRPLDAALKEFFEKQGIPYVLDAKSLKEEGLKPDEPVSFAAKGTSIASALSAVLDRLGLATIVRMGAVEVTGAVTADEHHFARLYDISDFAAAGVDYDVLADGADVLTLWRGGKAQVVWQGLLLVNADEHHHELLVKSLLMLRETLGKDGLRPAAPVDRDERIETRWYTAPPGTAASFSTALTAVVEPESWKDGTASIQVVGDNLLIRNSRRAHREIEQLINTVPRPPGKQ